MAIRPLNSIEGFSVGQDPQIPVIDSNGNITATNLTVSGVSNLGLIGNVAILGGTVGQAIVTDGTGNLSFQSITAESNRAAPMPYNIPNGDSYIVNENFQGLFAYPITIDGELVVDGMLIEVGVNIDSIPGQVFFDDNGNPTGNAGFTFDSVSGNFAVPGNSTFSGNLLPSSNLVYDLGNATRRWNDLYLSGNTIYLGDSTITTDANTLTFTNGSGGTFEVGGNAAVTTIQNGTSNIAVNVNGNVTTSVAGNANVVVVTGSGADISGALAVTGNVSGNVFSGNGSGLTALTGANVTGTVANATYAVSAGTAGTVTTAAQPNITSVGTLTSLDVTGNVAADYVKTVGYTTDRANVAVTTGTVIDQFSPSDFRTAKYVISASGDAGYQSVETLLVHDGVDAYITIYGSICSNIAADIIDITANINGVSGNVALYATAGGANVVVNVVASYIKT